MAAGSPSAPDRVSSPFRELRRIAGALRASSSFCFAEVEGRDDDVYERFQQDENLDGTDSVSGLTTAARGLRQANTFAPAPPARYHRADLEAEIFMHDLPNRGGHRKLCGGAPPRGLARQRQQQSNTNRTAPTQGVSPPRTLRPGGIGGTGDHYLCAYRRRLEHTGGPVLHPVVGSAHAHAPDARRATTTVGFRVNILFETK